ncbi:hypothetical protein TIFTF001_034427 [Ficus carica]|uniref:Uncharacterized protein n=1 Tax=Ficus carica TaxID=3494 RepID=A0AA88E068_FICCA|nr:hypothetical protein TIFTF001_034427 [Ficus carica]
MGQWRSGDLEEIREVVGLVGDDVVAKVVARGEARDPARGRIWIFHEEEWIFGDYCGEIERMENLLERKGGLGSAVKENESPATAAARSRDLEEIREPAGDEGWIGIRRERDQISGDCGGEIREPAGDKRQIGNVMMERAPEIRV